MHTFFRLRHASLVTDTERRLIFFAEEKPDAHDAGEKVEPQQDRPEAEDPAVEEPEHAEVQGDARLESAEEVVAKKRQDLNITDENLRDLQLRARTMKGYKDGKVQLSDGSEVGPHEFDAKDNQDAQRQLQNLHRLGAITDAELPAKPQNAPVAPKKNPKAGPQNGPPADPVQIEADAQDKLLDNGKGGVVDWTALKPDEKEERKASVMSEYGVSVDDTTGKVTVAKDEGEAKWNRFGGTLSKIGTALGKFMEKFQGMFAKLNLGNGAPKGPANNSDIIESDVMGELLTKDVTALRAELNTKKQAAVANVNKYSPEVAKRLEDEATASLQALDKMVEETKKTSEVINEKLTNAKSVMKNLKKPNSFGDLPDRINNVTLDVNNHLHMKLISNQGEGDMDKFRSEFIKISGKSLNELLPQGVDEKQAFIKALDQIIVKAKKEQA